MTKSFLDDKRIKNITKNCYGIPNVSRGISSTSWTHQMAWNAENVMNSSALCHWLQWLVQFLKNYKILNRFSKKKSVNFVISEFSKTFENSMRIEILKNFKINILRPTMSWNQLHSALSKCSASEVHCLDAFSPRECSWRGILKISFQIQSSKDY